MRPEDLDFNIQRTDFLSEDSSQFFSIFEKIFKFYFFARDAEGALTYISPKISAVLGYEPEEFKKNWKKYLTEHLANKEVILRSEFPKFSGKHIKPYNVEIKSKNGENIWLDIHEAPVLDPAGNIVKYHGLAIDTTARKNQENQLRMREKTVPGNQPILTHRNLSCRSQRPDDLRQPGLADHHRTSHGRDTGKSMVATHSP